MDSRTFKFTYNEIATARRVNDHMLDRVRHIADVVSAVYEAHEDQFKAAKLDYKQQNPARNFLHASKRDLEAGNVAYPDDVDGNASFYWYEYYCGDAEYYSFDFPFYYLWKGDDDIRHDAEIRLLAAIHAYEVRVAREAEEEEKRKQELAEKRERQQRAEYRRLKRKYEGKQAKDG